MVGRITIQQVRVFGVFSAAFVMTALSTTFAHMAENALALMTGLMALVLIVKMFLEAQKAR